MFKNLKSRDIFIGLLFIPILLFLASIYSENQKQMVFVGSIIMIIFFLLFILYIYKKREEDRALKSLLLHIDQHLSSKELQLLSASLDINDKKKVYHYLESVWKFYDKNRVNVEKINRENEQFLINLSHEIRTPLNGILGFLQLLNETSLDQSQKDCISNINHSSEVLLEATSNILTLSQKNEEVMVINEAAFDIFDKVEFVIDSFSQKAEQKNITLGIYTDPKLHRNWIGDSEKIVSVLMNLIDNAIQFTPMGGKINLFVEKTILEGQHTAIHFSVEDNRIGIDKNMQRIIVGSVIQSDLEVSRERRSNDNGLVTSSKMVKLLGGKLEIKSQKDNGVTFSFRLPLKEDHNQEVLKMTNLHSLKVGLALPDRSVYRDIDKFLEVYIRAFNAKFSIYYYDDLFGAKGYKVVLPDVLIFDHRYTRRKGYLNTVQSLECNTVLITTHNLKGQIDPYVHKFDSIIMSPATLDKTRKILEKFYKQESEFWAKNTETKTLKFKHTNVLVVEDNKVNQKLIKTLLEKFNLNVTLTSNGKEALHMRKDNRYDLIFMDIEMPIMDGVEATKKILQYEVEYGLTHVPIVALTANALIGDQEKYIKAGIDYYLSKPIRLQKLQHILEMYIKEKN